VHGLADVGGLRAAMWGLAGGGLRAVAPESIFVRPPQIQRAGGGGRGGGYAAGLKPPLLSPPS
jgi:hypothetical protein